MRARQDRTDHAPHEAQPADAATRSLVLAGRELTAPKAAPGLHIVATPIGNLGDITLRALETLAGVDVIACEDTRVTQRLTQRYGLRPPLTAYHDHNAAAARPKLLGLLAEGKALALVSDAGTPLISDPGFKLVSEATARGHAVHALPGPSAVMAALSLAALPTDRFLFEGFLPVKSAARRKRLAELARIDATLVLFESGARVGPMLQEASEVLGAREAAICRELTKLHEEITRGPLDRLAAAHETMETRGEFVVVIGPPSQDSGQLDANALDELLQRALEEHSLKDAVAQVAMVSGRPRREVYARALDLSKHASDTTSATGDGD